MCVDSRLYHISQNSGHVLHIVRSEQTIAGVIINSIRPQIVREFDQNEVHLSAQIILHAKYLPLSQRFEVTVVNGMDLSVIFEIKFRHKNAIHVKYLK